MSYFQPIQILWYHIMSNNRWVTNDWVINTDPYAPNNTLTFKWLLWDVELIIAEHVVKYGDKWISSDMINYWWNSKKYGGLIKKYWLWWSALIDYQPQIDKTLWYVLFKGG